jgi:hypothetical protein
MTWMNDLDCLDLGERPSEDPRATRGGDTFSVVERAAVADGSRFREVQRELRGAIETGVQRHGNQ